MEIKFAILLVFILKECISQITVLGPEELKNNFKGSNFKNNMCLLI
jgi:hypothetical protein